MNNALLNMKFVKLVECSHCKALCEYDKERLTCWACSTEIVVAEDTKIALGIKNTGATYTQYTAYAKCPNCRRLLSVGTTKCPDCCEELSEEYAFLNPLFELGKTMACDYARTITSAHSATVVIFLAVSVFLFGYSIATQTVALAIPIPFLSIIPLLFSILWFHRFGRMDDEDKEYLELKSEISRTLKHWILIFAGQLFVLFLLIFPH